MTTEGQAADEHRRELKSYLFGWEVLGALALIVVVIVMIRTSNHNTDRSECAELVMDAMEQDSKTNETAVTIYKACLRQRGWEN